MKIEKRVEKNNKIRKEGLIPGVIYGKKIESTPIQATYKEVLETYQKYGKSKTFKVKLDNKVHQVYLKDIQFDVMRPKDIVHFCLLKITASDTMTSLIPIHVIGKGEVERKGLILQLSIPALEVEFAVGTGINSIDIDVSKLDAGDAIHVKDLILPEGFKISIDADSVVANVAYPRTQEKEETAVEPASVEVIGEKETKNAE